MRTIKSQKTLAIPEGVTVSIKTRVVTVTGPRGKLSRSFAHLAIDLHLEEGGRRIRAELWFGNRLSPSPASAPCCRTSAT